MISVTELPCQCLQSRGALYEVCEQRKIWGIIVRIRRNLAGLQVEGLFVKRSAGAHGAERQRKLFVTSVENQRVS
jgi:hypothetical protein